MYGIMSKHLEFIAAAEMVGSTNKIFAGVKQ
jgi:hypothetical protein